MRSGAYARSKSRPATSPLRSSSSRNGPLVVPGNVVDRRTARWPRRRPAAMVAAASRTAVRSGFFAASIGVGTHTNQTSAERTASADGVTTESPLPRAARRRSSVMSPIGEIPARTCETRS